MEESNNDNSNDNDLEHSKDNQLKNTDEASGIYDSSFAEDDFNKLQTRKNNLAESTSLSLNNILSESIQELIPLGTLQSHQHQSNINPNLNINNYTSQNIENNYKLETNRDSITLSNFDFLTNRDHLSNTNNENLAQNVNSNTNTTTGANTNFNANNHLHESINFINDSSKNKKYKNNQDERRRDSKKKPSSVQVKTNPLPSTIPEHELEMIKIGNVDDMERIFNKPGLKQDRRNSKSLKADTGPIHAIWTDKVKEYQSRLPSVKKFQKLQEMKEQFETTIDQNTVEIHKRLEDLMKKRLTNSSVKYSSIDFKERGLHSLLNKMNQSVIDHHKFEDSKNSPEPKYYQWYSELEYLIENYYNRNDFLLGKLLDKLAVYGKLNAKKSNEVSFFRVLESLKIWELISPDVISAVEFCREKILEIEVEEFESWFKDRHPKFFVPRSPSSLNMTDNKENNKAKN